MKPARTMTAAEYAEARRARAWRQPEGAPPAATTTARAMSTEEYQRARMARAWRQAGKEPTDV